MRLVGLQNTRPIYIKASIDANVNHKFIVKIGDRLVFDEVLNAGSSESGTKALTVGAEIVNNPAGILMEVEIYHIDPDSQQWALNKLQDENPEVDQANPRQYWFAVRSADCYPGPPEPNWDNGVVVIHWDTEDQPFGEVHNVKDAAIRVGGQGGGGGGGNPRPGGGVVRPNFAPEKRPAKAASGTRSKKKGA